MRLHRLMVAAVTAAALVLAAVGSATAATAQAKTFGGTAGSATAATAQAKTFGGTARDAPSPIQTLAPGTELHTLIAPGRDNLPYGGGPVLHSNRTHVIFWAPAGSGLAFEPGYQSLIETFLSDVAADSHRTTNVYGLSGQYGDGAGPAAYDSSYGGSVVATDPLPANGCAEPPMTGPGWTVCLTDAQLETEIQRVIASEHLPTTGRDVYFLVTPDGLGSCTDAGSSSCALGGSVSGYCGYHSYTGDGIVYAVIPYNAVPGHCQQNNPRPNSSPADPTVSTISHEHNEMVTDPNGDAWIDSRGDEDGDLCLTSFGPSLSGRGVDPRAAWNETVHGGHFFLQEEWSNADSRCEPRARPDALSFAASRASGRARSLSFSARGSAPQGRVVAWSWFFGDGRTAFGRRVSHTFKIPGSYRVMLRATDTWGNWAFAWRTVRIRGS